MCQFCHQHGEGKKWYLQAKNYAEDLLGDLRRRKYIADFFVDPQVHLRSVVEGGQIPEPLGIVEHHLLAPMLCAKQCAFNADEIIQRKKIVIVNLYTGSHSDPVAKILGTFLVEKIIASQWRRGVLPDAERIRHFLFVDEFQDLMHKGEGCRAYSCSR